MRYISTWESGQPETPCGSGSKIENTEIIRDYLAMILENYEIQSVADVGCGDRNWIELVDGMEDVGYQGFDVVPLSRDVIKFDCVKQVLHYPVDLILCICVLNHLPPKSAARSLRNFKASGSKYLLMSNTTIDRFDVPFEAVENIHNVHTKRCTGTYNLWRLNHR